MLTDRRTETVSPARRGTARTAGNMLVGHGDPASWGYAGPTGSQVRSAGKESPARHRVPVDFLERTGGAAVIFAAVLRFRRGLRQPRHSFSEYVRVDPG